MAGIEIEGADQLRALAARLAEADKSVGQALAKGLRAAAKPVVAEIRATVKEPGGGSPSTGAGSKARAAYRLSRSKSKRDTAAASAARRSGLRQTIAAATGSSVTTGGKDGSRTNLTFKMKSAQLPPEQRTLGKRWNKPQGWKHPVFGHDTWVQQLGRPYFDKVIKSQQPVLEAGVKAAMVLPERILAAGEL